MSALPEMEYQLLYQERVLRSVANSTRDDVRSLLHGGDNKIEVTVVNSLTNYVSTIQWPKNPVNPMAHFPPTSAGLLGPVFLEYQTLSKREFPHGRELQ